jgi:hypothetical protein
VKKCPSDQITTLVPIKQEMARDLDLAHGFESELFIILVLARKPFSQ